MREGGAAPPAHAGVEAIAREFCALSEKRRSTVLRLVVDYIPTASFVALHAATPPQKLDYDRAAIYLRARTRQEQFRLRACAKEPFTIAWIHERIGADDVLYDIGANVGAYSLVAACRPGSRVRVVAFEPGYASVASMCDNIVLNGVGARVMPLPVALSDTTDMGALGLRNLGPGTARHAQGDEEGVVYRQPVMTFRLDDVVAWFGLPPPNHVKLDVDGGELAVLRGAARTLASPTLRSVLVEVSTDLSAEVTGALASHGLRLDSKMGVHNKAGVEAVWYGLFVRDAA